MKIESIDKNSFITIEFVDCEIERFPSVSCAISIHDRDFSGHNKDVWFDLISLKDFIKKLRSLEETRENQIIRVNATFNIFCLWKHMFAVRQASASFFCEGNLYFPKYFARQHKKR